MLNARHEEKHDQYSVQRNFPKQELQGGNYMLETERQTVEPKQSSLQPSL